MPCRATSRRFAAPPPELIMRHVVVEDPPPFTATPSATRIDIYRAAPSLATNGTPDPSPLFHAASLSFDAFIAKHCLRFSIRALFS